MSPHSKYFVVEFVGIAIAIICVVYTYFKYVTLRYWKRKNIEYVKPVVPFGNIWPLLSGRSSIGELFRDLYFSKKKSPVFGIYLLHKPALVVNDPNLIRFVLTKEFAHFHDRGVYCNEKIDPLSAHLFAVPGEKWRFLRSKFSPTFTSSKMRQMFFTMGECSEKMAAYITDKAKNRELVEIKNLVARFSTDVIASVAFGIQANSIENPDAEFRKWGQKFFQPNPLKNLLLLLAPTWLDLFKIPVIEKDISKFFISAFTETVEYRIANDVVRKDFLDLIMQLMNKGYIDNNDEKTRAQLSGIDRNKITMLEGAAQAFVFWLAGFETSSSTVTNCLYELALHQDMQEKLADEINKALAANEFGSISYDSIKEMPYLDKVISETLRKYPAIPILNRECTEEIDLPGTGLRVAKGTAIIIPVYGIHSDPGVFPEPEKFDPERFTEENIASRHQYHYLPFGEGPRNCIDYHLILDLDCKVKRRSIYGLVLGMRFGLLQTKVALAKLLSKYRFKPGPGLKVPMVLDKGNIPIGPAGGMILRIEER